MSRSSTTGRVRGSRFLVPLLVLAAFVLGFALRGGAPTSGRHRGSRSTSQEGEPRSYFETRAAER